MEKPKTSSLINAGVLLLSAIGALLGSWAHEKEMEELKEEIKSDLQKENSEEES